MNVLVVTVIHYALFYTLFVLPSAFKTRFYSQGDAQVLRSLGQSSQHDLSKLLELCNGLCERTEHQNAIYRLARSLEGKVNQAQRWLAAPRGPQRQVGYEACRVLVTQAGQIIQPLVAEATSRRGLMNSGGVSDAAAQDHLDAFEESSRRLQHAADQLFSLAGKPFSMPLLFV